MITYYLKSTNAPIHIGDPITLMSEEETLFGKIEVTKKFFVTKENLNALIEAGVLSKSSKITLEDVNKELVKTLSISLEGLDSLHVKCPIAYYILIMHMLAFMYNKRVSEATDFTYIISMADGQVHSRLKRDTGIFPYFYRKEDAFAAQSVLESLYKGIYVRK